MRHLPRRFCVIYRLRILFRILIGNEFYFDRRQFSRLILARRTSPKVLDPPTPPHSPHYDSTLRREARSAMRKIEALDQAYGHLWESSLVFGVSSFYYHRLVALVLGMLLLKCRIP